MIRPHFMDHYRQWKNWGKNAQVGTNCYVSQSVQLWDQTRENGRCGHHSFKLMPDQMFPLNNGKTLQPWLPSTNVSQVISILVFIQGTCVRVLSVLISTSLFVFPRKPGQVRWLTVQIVFAKLDSECSCLYFEALCLWNNAAVYEFWREES